MGFLRQTFLFSLLDPKAPVGDTETELAELGHIVGYNIALINDLYGLKKDILTGDVNILLKHHHSITRKAAQPEMDLTASLESLSESIQWAMEEIKKTVRYIEDYYSTHPNSLVTKCNIAMGCVSGNHGAHATCKRFELPEGFEWPQSLHE